MQINMNLRNYIFDSEIVNKYSVVLKMHVKRKFTLNAKNKIKVLNEINRNKNPRSKKTLKSDIHFDFLPKL